MTEEELKMLLGPKLGTGLNPGEARNVPQNAIGEFLSRNLGGLRGAMNRNLGIPFVETGIGLGDLLMGEAPEYIEDLSWGAPFIEPSGHGGRLDTRLGDVLGLPIPYAGAAKGVQLGGKQLLKKGADATGDAVDMSRRDALKKMGVTGAAAAFPMTALKVMKETGSSGVGSSGAGSVASGAEQLSPYFSKGMADSLAADIARPAAGAVAEAVMTNRPMMSAISYFKRYPFLLPVLKREGPEGVDKFTQGMIGSNPVEFQSSVDELIKKYEGAPEIDDLVAKYEEQGNLYGLVPNYGDLPENLDTKQLIKHLDEGTMPKSDFDPKDYENPYTSDKGMGGIFSDDSPPDYMVADWNDMYRSLWNAVNQGQVDVTDLQPYVKKAMEEVRNRFGEPMTETGKRNFAMMDVLQMHDSKTLYDNMMERAWEDMERYGDGVEFFE